MSTTLKGNAVVAQSGGPTAVINASACGVVQGALRYADCIPTVYGAINGVLGIVHEELFDFRAESPEEVERLKASPSAALGSCRYKLGDLESDRGRYQRLLDVFAAHDVRYFFYIGGNDSMDTANKVHRLAQETGYELRVIGVPKTIDNDLVGTDHCPGYGSVAKYLATSVMEAGRDTDAMYTFDPVTITEAMGRNTGWIAAATGMAGRVEDEAPHLIYVPEIPFSIDKFLADVRECHRQRRRAFVVVSEGIVDEKGEYIAAQASVDAFGHRQLGGVAAMLADLVTKELGLKCRHNKLDTCQRNAMHFASLTDRDEAYECGVVAVRSALEGHSGRMVALTREGGQAYDCRTRLLPLSEIANRVKRLPREYMNEAGTHISDKMREYVKPLMRGEVPITIGEDGLPRYARLRRRALDKRLPPFQEKD